MILPDLLANNLKIVFCGTATGYKSVDDKRIYIEEDNIFFTALRRFGFTSDLLSVDKYTELLDYGIGLTDLVKYKFRHGGKLNEEFYDKKSFESNMLKYQPQIVCFNGKEAAKWYFNFKSSSQINYGLQKEVIGRTKIYIATSTSKIARKYWDDSIWQHLKTLIN